MDETNDSERSIARRDLPAVVRRAAELAAFADDADEQLSEQEVIRIAAELGLAPRHVRQALYEGATEETTASFLDRYFPPPRLAITRAVPMEVAAARRALEDYLVTQEYLQIVRRQADSTTFEPASDAVSKVARTFHRSSKHQMARALHLDLATRSLEPGWSHVRIRALYKDERKSHIAGVIVGSTLLGVPAGAGLGVIVGGAQATVTGGELAIVGGVMAGFSALSAIGLALFGSAKTRYKHWRERTQLQTEALLDRLEKGDELRPPPAPWLRKIQMKFGPIVNQ